jgi:hypothetical protein
MKIKSKIPRRVVAGVDVAGGVLLLWVYDGLQT